LTLPPPNVDPKYAIRLGCAAAGRVTQFLTPPKQFERPLAFSERMLAVWRDSVRQLGVRAIPQHTLGDAVPTDMQYVGLWMIKRRADGPTHRAQHLPVAVIISPNQPTVRGTAPGLQDWVDYRTLLLYLADEGAKPVPDKPLDRQATMATFVKRLIAQLRNTTTLLVTRDQTEASPLFKAAQRLMTANDREFFRQQSEILTASKDESRKQTAAREIWMSIPRNRGGLRYAASALRASATNRS
jgi:hypothetical protein